MNKEQREALQALADVMEEHDIQMSSNWYPIEVFVGGHEYPNDFALYIDTSDIGKMQWLNGKTITKLLEQE